jgi:hypothetical protein
MEDFDEAEEQNEEDLVELGDSFGSINLKVKYHPDPYRTTSRRL